MDKYRKALVAGLAFVLTVVTQLLAAGLVNDQWTIYAQIFITLAGAYGVYAVRNAPAIPPVD